MSAGAGTVWGGVLLFIFVTILGSILGGVGPIGVFGGEEEEGGVRSRPGAARTILLFHIISARPSKQPRMVGTFLRYTCGLGWRMHCGVEVTYQ